MNRNQLKYFVAAAESRSFTKAAEQFYISQTAITQQMQLLEGYILRVLGELVEDIASGNVQPNPYTRGSSHNACRFCPYGQVCHSDSVEGRRNYKAMTAEQFWEQVEREMTKNG